MSRLVLTSELLTRLRKDLLKDENETCAILFGRSVETNKKLSRIVIREALTPPIKLYEERTTVSAQLRPEIVSEVAQRARKTGESITFVHTHPFSLNHFSATDDAGETELSYFLAGRAPHARHAAMLITPEVAIARELGKKNPLRVLGIGPQITFGETGLEKEKDPRYDRQIRAFGALGQQTLKSIRVGIVGLGGTGSVVLQSLLHLGVQDFLLIDPDTIEETNLNRLVGATPEDVGRFKADVAASWGKKLNSTANIETQRDSILKEAVVKLLADTDFVFCCTDSHGSRAVLNQFSYQYLVPCIDMGVAISAQKGLVTDIVGRTQLFAPGLACMVCGNLLDSEEIRRDLLTDFERQMDPYIIGDTEPAPSVISLNSTIASLAVTMFLNTVIGVPGTPRFLNYNAIKGICRPALCTPHPTCIVCSPSGAICRANEWPLPARQD